MAMAELCPDRPMGERGPMLRGLDGIRRVMFSAWWPATCQRHVWSRWRPHPHNGTIPGREPWPQGSGEWNVNDWPGGHPVGRGLMASH
jgi:hypothetical protein